MDDDRFLGRTTERAISDRFLEALRDDVVALVIHGEPGIGKTTFLTATADAALGQGLRVLMSRPARSDMAYSHAALGDLLRPHADRLRDLPRPQRQALEAAILRADPVDGQVDAHVVGVATAGVLAALADESPTVVAIDDTQWLDGPSRRALEFAARRAGGLRLGFLLAERAVDEPDPLFLRDAMQSDRRLVVRLGALTVAAIRHLVARRMGADLSRADLVRISDASGGNPFYAMALVQSARDQGMPGAASDPLPLPESLTELVGARIASLPASSRAALGAAALLSRPTVALLDGILDAPDSTTRLAPAVSAGIIRFHDETIEFTHPLLAEAALASMTAAERTRIHLRAARLVPEAEAQAHHLAAGSRIPDAATARIIADGARAAATRGAPGTASALFSAAARLTPDGQPELRSSRFLDAAFMDWNVGDVASVRHRLAGLPDDLPDGVSRSRALMLASTVATWAD